MGLDFRFYDEVQIPSGNVKLDGELIVPLNAESVVIFSHGSGSSRFSSRNRMVAGYLHQNNIGTLLFDLLTEEEDKLYKNRFNINLLTQRLCNITTWLEQFPAAKDCTFGFFGASTGAASALKAAVLLPQIATVVCRGGRPDLALEELHKIKIPVLLIVGSRDFDVLQLNMQAYNELTSAKKIEIVDGATHLFEEPGKMEMVANLAAKWFINYLQHVKAN